jgi:fructosamine-3-kinase
MNERRSIEGALRAAGVTAKLLEVSELRGGCIHRVHSVRLGSGLHLVAKVAAQADGAMLQEEALGLAAIGATQTVLVPQVVGFGVHDGAAVLLMTAIEPRAADEGAWRRFGEELAALHAAGGATAFGFEHDNHLGATPQPNRWCDDWVRFNAEERLGYQLGLATRRGLLAVHEARRVEKSIARLGDLLPAQPSPALLHGDLWSGNALPSAGEGGRGRIAVIDPACSFGDGWADIAMMRLFGGFPECCFEVYADAAGEPANVEARIAVYQLYHALNHVNLFGRGYVGMVMGLVARIL